MQSKKVETLFYSALGVGLLFLIVVGVNLLVSPVRARLDLTAEKAHSLTDGTKTILKRLDTPVKLRFYCSKSGNRMPSQLRNYAQTVEDLLEEYRASGGGNVILEKIDPEPDSENEDLAKLDGVEPIPSQTGEPFYLGLTVAMDPQKQGVPLPPDREKLLEYDITRAVSRVMSTNKPIVGIMTPLPVNGQPMNPMMMRMGQRGAQPWVTVAEIKRDFEVKTVPMDTDKIDDDIRTLLVIHPKEITDKAQFAIDQFVLRGGKLVAFVDPYCDSDTAAQNPQFGGMNLGSSSSLPKLFKAWGLDFDASKIVADRTLFKPIPQADGRTLIFPGLLWLTPQAINESDVLVSQSDNYLLGWAGAFTGKVADGLKETILLHSTTDAQLVEGFMARNSGQKILDEFKASGVTYPLAVRLQGKLKTAFPDGKPADTKPADPDKKDEKKDDKKSDALKESKDENVVYLFGDADLLADNFCVRQIGFGMAMPFNGNLPLFQSLVEQSAGHASLASMRARGSLRRPFTVVQEKQAAAQKTFQAEIEKFQKEAQESQHRIAEIQSKREGTKKLILSPEAKAELEVLQKKEVEANKQLRVVQRNLNKEVKSLEFWTKVLNIAAVPLAVTAVGLIFGIMRKNRTVAK